MNEWEQRITDTLQRDPHSVSNGIHLVSATADHVRLQMTIRPESRNIYGMTHGGALFALADDAAGTAAHTDGRTHVTQNATLHFLRNQPEGVLTAEAVVRHRGGSTCLVDVDLRNTDGVLLASGSFSYFCVDKTRLEREAAARSKN